MKKVKFTDWWKGFDPKKDPLFYDFLFSNYSLKMTNILSRKPDVLFSNVPFFGTREARKYPNTTKIFYSGEFISDETIYSILNQGHYLIYSKSIDHPNYLQLGEIERLMFFGQNLKYEIPVKKRFCSFIYHSNKTEHICKREEFCLKLDKIKSVDRLGNSLRNQTDSRLNPRFTKKSNGGFGITNINVIKDYKFNIAYENRSERGYLTEKIWWGFLANTISVYWGDPDVYDTFNKGSFLCRHDYNSDEELIENIIHLDNNDKDYNEMLLSEKIKNEYRFSEERLKEFFNKILL